LGLLAIVSGDGPGVGRSPRGPAGRAASSWTPVGLAQGCGRRPASQTPWKASHATERNGMALFSHLLSRIWGHADTAAPTAASPVGVPAATPASDAPADAPAAPAAPADAPAAPAAPAAPVDVAAVLNGLAATPPRPPP